MSESAGVARFRAVAEGSHRGDSRLQFQRCRRGSSATADRREVPSLHSRLTVRSSRRANFPEVTSRRSHFGLPFHPPPPPLYPQYSRTILHGPILTDNFIFHSVPAPSPSTVTRTLADPRSRVAIPPRPRPWETRSPVPRIRTVLFSNLIRRHSRGPTVC